MRKFLKILIPALLLIAIVVSCTVLFSSAADENVIYVAAQSRGDGTGSSPENAMGHGTYTGTITRTDSPAIEKSFVNAPYQEVVDYIYTLNYGTVQDGAANGSRLYQQSALYKAFSALTSKGGTIVVMEELGIEVVTKLAVNTATDNDFPYSTKAVTLTSNYGGVDYRTQGAKFVLNSSKWNDMLWDTRRPIIMKDLNVEYRYTTKYTQTNWEKDFSIYSSGFDFVVDTGVNVTSVAYDGNMNTTPGTRYPNIFAGRRYASVTGNPVITVKSGNWGGVFAAGHGYNASNPATVTGNVSINIMGGNVASVNGGGSIMGGKNFAKVSGNLVVNITGGEVNSITAATGAGVTGDVDILVKDPAFVAEILPTTASATANSIDVKYDAGTVEFIQSTDKFTTVDPPFDPNAEKVIYISSTGTGKGNSPANAMGHGNYTGTVTHTIESGANAGVVTKAFSNETYAKVFEYLYTLQGGKITFSEPLYAQNALYKAFDKLKSTGGKIVVVDEVKFDAFSSLANSTVADTVFPTNTKEITITSIYGSNNYKNSGAKLVFDHSVWNAGLIELMGPVTFKDINLEYRYHTQSTMGAWEDGFSIYTGAKNFTVDTGVSVTSTHVSANGSTSAGDRFINIFAGRRYRATSGNPVITIKSGTWRAVYAAGHGYNASNPASLTGNVTINVSGGLVQNIYGGGSVKNNKDFTEVKGNLAINVTGGVVNAIYATSSKGVTGDVDVNIAEPAVVGTVSAKTDKSTANSIDLKYVEGTVDFIVVEGFTTIDPPYDPNAEKVIYISADGTGNGKTPDSPMGHSENYTANVAKMYELLDKYGNFDKLSANGTDDEKKLVSELRYGHVLYRAFEALAASDGGRIVLVGDVAIDIVSSRMPNKEGQKYTPAEFALPDIKDMGMVTVTSSYAGNNYGGKLVLDLDKCNTTFLELKSPVTFENIEMVHKYDPDDLNGWGIPFGFAANGVELVMGEGVVVTSVNADTGKEGDKYPLIIGGSRYNTKPSTNVTVKSGTWDSVIAGGFGNSSAAAGNISGNAKLVIEGGKIGTVYGTGSQTRATGTVKGSVTITINGGEIDKFFFTNTVEYLGTGSVVTLGANAKIKFADYAVNGYGGDLKDLKARVQLFNNSDVQFGPPVIYVSANGTGNGKTPENPIGHSATYTTDVAKMYTLLDKYGNFDKLNKEGTQEEKDFVSNLRKGHAFYRAFEALADTNGGTLVLVGDVAIDIVSSRMPNKEGQSNSPAEFVLPNAMGLVTVTSVYEDKNYGGKLILDLDKCNTTFLEISSAVTFENLEMVHKYDPNDLNGWGTSFGFVAGGNTLVMGDGVVVTSLNADTNKEGDMYPIIIGGHRYNKKSNSNLTIKSGTWDMVIAGGFGNSAASPATVTGNAKLVIEGGKIGTVYGTGSQTKATGTVEKTVTITVNGGEIERLYFANAVEYLGTGSVVTLGKDAKITFADYAVKKYAGDLADLKSRVKFINECGVELGKEPYIPPMVIYIASNGTGDGSSPESPLGNAPGYKENLQKMYDLLKSVKGYNNISKLSEADQQFIGSLYKDNVLYRAFELANKKDTVIVIVGDIAVDIVSSRMTYRTGEKQSPAEFTLPASEHHVTITSVYGGQDFRSQAKFILDLAACNTTNLVFRTATTIENVNIEHRYNNDDKNGWSTPFIFAANGNEFVIGENVKVTSFDTSTNTEGTWFPGIIGGHRYANITGNADVTIKSGTWSIVHAGSYGNSGTYGKINGNATLNIEGGKIEAVYGTSSLAKPTASITKKLTINITGGFVEALYATAKNGATNEIVVNIYATAERVAKAWGGTSDTNIPANATINYVRAVTRDDEVKYWTTVNFTGNVEDQPEPYIFTLYIANVSKGKGDGSSPENAMGHADGYAKLRKQALDIIAANGGTNTGLKDAQKAITGAVYTKNALYRALTYSGNKIVNQGGMIVVCGPLSIDATDCMRKSLADFWTPVGAETITITSYDGTTNFRNKGAKLTLDTSEAGLCLEFGFPVTFDNITIEHKYNSKNGKGLNNGAIIAGRGNKITIGYNVKVTTNDVNPDEDARVEMYPSICGGHRYSDSKSDNYVVVSSGQWAAVVGGDWGSAHTGNATIGINGGKIGTVCGTTNPTNGNTKHIFNGSVWIGLWGGEVDNVYVVGKPGMIWGDASIGLGGTTINGKVRAVHPDYEGEEDIQGWVFNYTDKQVNTKQVIGFDNPVPATGSALPYLAVVATVSLVGAAVLIISKKKKAVNN